ncbi:hypothetical protein SAMN05920897_103140 [Alkalispirochaeta americana]|uniref:Uncharacterized protein n=1 Tax=Alkalispirochaeta americana TaxID=159291 RepID=A0A1N6PUQ0_9SPIO|nr:hypothetical protein [Alkalispirochaeta americana]SIQ07987.1 hypothetical protein SAMN05920897_103140 [Alkalispirochaeta americana]
MTELEFTLFAPSLETGDLVMMERIPAAREPSETIPGVILRFLDPAKPILFYRVPPGGDSAGLEFLQDLLYSPDTPFPVGHCSFWQPRKTPPEAENFLNHLEEIAGLPLRREGDLFDAYATGVLGNHYPLPHSSPLVEDPRNVSTWTAAVAALLGVQTRDYQVLREESPAESGASNEDESLKDQTSPEPSRTGGSHHGNKG